MYRWNESSMEHFGLEKTEDLAGKGNARKEFHRSRGRLFCFHVFCFAVLTEPTKK